jgi:hypothetical protein
MTTTLHLTAAKEWVAHASDLRRIAVRLTERPTLNAVEQVAALTHLADEIEAEAEDYKQDQGA